MKKRAGRLRSYAYQRVGLPLKNLKTRKVGILSFLGFLIFQVKTFTFFKSKSVICLNLLELPLGPTS